MTRLGVFIYLCVFIGTTYAQDTCSFTMLSNGIAMPWVGFGTAAMGGVETEKAVKHAIEAGIRHFDGAEATEWYDDIALGKALEYARIHEPKLDRSELFITTKLHPKHHGTVSSYNAITKMLENLRTDYIDALIIHFPACGAWIPTCNDLTIEGTWRDSWRTMEKLYDENVVRAIGVSNFGIDELKQLWKFARIKPQIVQNWFDPYHPDTQIVEFCMENGIQYVGYSSLGGQWEYQPAVKRNIVQESDVLHEIAKKHNTSVTFVVLSWALQRGVAIIPRSTNPKHIRSNAQLLTFNPDTALLDGDDMAQIDKLGTSIDLNDNCKLWASQGECKGNPNFMLTNCMLSCSQIDD